MSTIKDFENAPIGATATHPLASRAMKTDNREGSWVTPRGNYFSDEGMVNWGYTLDPLEPCPASAREALDLAWELAHEVKVGQVIPEGARYLEIHGDRIREYTAPVDLKIRPELASVTRTLEPLPDPTPELPDWLDAPAIMARVDDRNLQQIAVFTPTGAHDRWTRNGTEWTFHWNELRDVTPLYPEGKFNASY